jgi:hypothetical protein
LFFFKFVSPAPPHPSDFFLSLEKRWLGACGESLEKDAHMCRVLLTAFDRPRLFPLPPSATLSPLQFPTKAQRALGDEKNLQQARWCRPQHGSLELVQGINMDTRAFAACHRRAATAMRGKAAISTLLNSDSCSGEEHSAQRAAITMHSNKQQATGSRLWHF